MAADWDIAMAIKPMKYKYCSLRADMSHSECQILYLDFKNNCFLPLATITISSYASFCASA